MNTPTITPLPSFIPRKPNKYKPRVPVTPVAEPIGPVSILSAVAAEDGQSLVLTFSAGPVSVNTGVTPDFNFAVGGAAYFIVNFGVAAGTGEVTASVVAGAPVVDAPKLAA